MFPYARAVQKPFVPPPPEVPEPGTLALILPGLLLIVPMRQRILAAVKRSYQRHENTKEKFGDGCLNHPN
jgi:hypothetical protein